MSQTLSKIKGLRTKKRKYPPSAFPKIFDDWIITKIKTNKFLTCNLKNRQTISDFFSKEISSSTQNYRIIVLKSCPYNGADYFMNYMKTLYSFTDFGSTEALDSVEDFIDYFSELESKIKWLKNKEKRILNITNFPLQLIKESMSYSKNNEIRWCFNNIKKEWIARWNTRQKGEWIVFWWEDYEINQYMFDSLFGKEITKHPRFIVISLKPITFFKYSTLVKDLFPQFTNLNNIPDDVLQFVNLSEIINLKLLKEYLFNYFNQIDIRTSIPGGMNNENEFSLVLAFSKGSTQSKGSQFPRKVRRSNDNSNNNNKNKDNNNFVKDDHDLALKTSLFHWLGKILYNKRYDPIRNTIRTMNRKELLASPSPPLYYNPQELLDSVPSSLREFSYLLQENCYSHFKLIGDWSNVWNCFSYTDTIDGFLYNMKEKNVPAQDQVSNMKHWLNIYGVIAFNLSQNTNENNFQQLRKSKYHYTVVKQIDEEYYDCLENFGNLNSISKYAFKHQVRWWYKRWKHKHSVKEYNYAVNYEGKDIVDEDYIETIVSKTNKVNTFAVDDASVKGEKDKYKNNNIFEWEGFLNNCEIWSKRQYIDKNLKNEIEMEKFIESQLNGDDDDGFASVDSY